MNFEAYREHDGSRIPESNIKIDLKNKRLLHTRLYLRPGMGEDIKAHAASLLYRTRRQAARVWDDVSDNVATEFHTKSRLIQRNLPDVSRMEMFSDADIATFQRDVQITQRAWRRMFYNDEFYMKTVYRTAGRTAEAIRELADKVTTRLKMCVEARLAELAEMTAEIRQWCKEVCHVIVEHAENVKHKIAVWYGDTSHVMLAKFTEFHTWAMNETSVYRAIFKDTATHMAEKVIDFIAPYIEAYYMAYNQVMMWVDSQMQMALQKVTSM